MAPDELRASMARTLHRRTGLPPELIALCVAELRLDIDEFLQGMAAELDETGRRLCAAGNRARLYGGAPDDALCGRGEGYIRSARRVRCWAEGDPTPPVPEQERRT